MLILVARRFTVYWFAKKNSGKRMIRNRACRSAKEPTIVSDGNHLLIQWQVTKHVSASIAQ